MKELRTFFFNLLIDTIFNYEQIKIKKKELVETAQRLMGVISNRKRRANITHNQKVFSLKLTNLI